MKVLVTVAQEMRREVGRPKVLSDLVEDRGDTIIVEYAGKQYEAEVHTAQDGLHWSEIMRKVSSK